MTFRAHEGTTQPYWPVDQAALRALLRRGEARELAADLRLMRTIESEHLARREAAVTETERDAADALLADIRSQIADTHRRYTLVKINKDGTKIRDEWAAKVRSLADALSASQHEGYTKEYREQEKARLIAEFHRTTEHHRSLLDQWYAEQRALAQTAYENEPEGDSATETRRLRRAVEAEALAKPFESDAARRTIATKRLIPEAGRLLAVGAVEKARTHYEAAKRLGAEDGSFERALTEVLNRTEPHRRDALQAMQAIEGEMTQFRLDVVKTRAVHGFGTPSQQVVDRENAAFLEWKQKREDQLIAEANGGQPRSIEVAAEDEAPALPRAPG